MTLTRRQILLALAACSACNTKEPPAPAPAAKLVWPRKSTHAGVEMIELFPGDADEKSPLVVAIHGMGDRPENWVEGWKSFPARAQVVLPRAFTAYGDGFSWFSYQRGRSDEELGPLVAAAEAKLWPAIVELAAGRKVIATGFSQGGILSYAMAARHADAVSHAFPVSGASPSALFPRDKAPAAPVLAFHGTADAMVDIDRDRKTIAAFKANGNQAELREYEGVGHTITPAMRADWYAALQKAITAG